MSFAARLAAARRGQADADDIADLARLALDEGEEEQALPLVLAAASRADAARLWQWAGLLQRGLDAHADAIDSFARRRAWRRTMRALRTAARGSPSRQGSTRCRCSRRPSGWGRRTATC